MSVRIADVEEILIGDQVLHDTGGKGSVHDVAKEKNKKGKKSKNNRASSADSEASSVSSETDLERSEAEDDTPEKGEKKKQRTSGKPKKIFPSHKSRRVGGKSNPTLSLWR